MKELAFIEWLADEETKGKASTTVVTVFLSYHTVGSILLRENSVPFCI